MVSEEIKQVFYPIHMYEAVLKKKKFFLLHFTFCWAELFVNVPTTEQVFMCGGGGGGGVL